MLPFTVTVHFTPSLPLVVLTKVVCPTLVPSSLEATQEGLEVPVLTTDRVDALFLVVELRFGLPIDTTYSLLYVIASTVTKP